MTARLISIIGPPAVGKTTLAEHLARALPAELVYEDYAGNEFLADSYAGKAEAALPAQLYYLMSRVKQLARATWPDRGTVVTDYGFCQDRIYARIQLSADDLALYRPLADRLELLVHAPDLIILLDASPPELLKRIAERGRQFERVMTAEFLELMRRSYDAIGSTAACEIIRIDCCATDLRQARARDELIERIRQWERR